MKQLENVTAQHRNMKPMKKTVPTVTTNVKNVLIYQPNVLNVLMKTELTMNFVHVMMDIMTSEMLFVHLVLYSVKPVQHQQIIVLFVLKDMPDHQLVNGSQSLNPLKLKTFQSDLLRSHIVTTDVKLVLKTQMIVYLVMSIDLVTHFAHVTTVGMKTKMKSVKNVVSDVLNVKLLPLHVPNVME